MKKIFNNFLFLLALSIIVSLPSTAYAKCNYSLSRNNNNSISIHYNENIKNEEYIEVFNSNNQKLFITQSDIDLLAKLVYAESRGEPFEGKVAVVSVVLNRTLNNHFPNTIKEVIFEPNAFSCVKNNKIKAYPDQNCYNAVYSAIKGNDPTNKALYFYNPNLTTSSWMINTEKHNSITIGNHIFFRK